MLKCMLQLKLSTTLHTLSTILSRHVFLTMYIFSVAKIINKMIPHHAMHFNIKSETELTSVKMSKRMQIVFSCLCSMLTHFATYLRILCNKKCRKHERKIVIPKPSFKLFVCHQ